MLCALLSESSALYGRLTLTYAWECEGKYIFVVSGRSNSISNMPATGRRNRRIVDLVGLLCQNKKKVANQLTPYKLRMKLGFFFFKRYLLSFRFMFAKQN